uniref:Uncharacterized protein n=1 Tax=Romanomermis culicivorax TaxID=13658 RepID=A0A915IJ64_ROMCU
HSSTKRLLRPNWKFYGRRKSAHSELPPSSKPDDSRIQASRKQRQFPSDSDSSSRITRINGNGKSRSCDDDTFTSMMSTIKKERKPSDRLEFSVYCNCGSKSGPGCHNFACSIIDQRPHVFPIDNRKMRGNETVSRRWNLAYKLASWRVKQAVVVEAFIELICLQSFARCKKSSTIDRIMRDIIHCWIILQV